MFGGLAAGLSGRAVLFELGAAIIFLGSLMQHPELEQYGARALSELKARGYEIPAASEPVRVYPGNTAGPFSSSHAGGWRPGVISLRENPLGSAGVEVYLRHELMHEAGFRTCAGKLPLWAEEAAAIDFSGEAGDRARQSEQPTSDELEHLGKRIRIGASLDKESYKALSKLVALHGWPTAPCAVSQQIEKILTPHDSWEDNGFSYILTSLVSGRVLESKGDLKTGHPPGSLLKIPYAAALYETRPEELPLGDASGKAVGEELAASDTARLLLRRSHFDLDRYRFLISMVKSTTLAQPFPPEELFRKDEKFWRRYLGERNEDGTFPFEANLRELALMLRACLLYKPSFFSGLSQNGFIEGSTLRAESERDRRVIQKIHAMSKTGTVTDERGNPLVGHLMVAWPAENPLYLAVFRSMGNNGASNLKHASRMLEEWSLRYSIERAKVRVRLMALTPRSSWQILDECPSLEKVERGNRNMKRRISTCGRFSILSSARGSRSERLVSGILESSADGQGENVVLETDSETYADGVLASEARELRGEASKALRAVIVWNGARGSGMTSGGGRHQDTSSLCDTTHCMVFQGELSERDGERRNARDQHEQHEQHGLRKRGDRPDHTDPHLLRLLDELAAKKNLDWLPFSKGGNEKWKKQIPVSELNTMLDEPAILEIQRERTRSGEVVVHLIYSENEETVPCEVFRARLKLPSCPEAIHFDKVASSWALEGIGKGHGQGLSVEQARVLAESGSSASAILDDAYR